MATSVRRREHPLSMRLPDADVALIDRAAGLRGRTRTDFVREAAVSAAHAVILESTLVRMSPDGFEAFEAAIAGDGQPVPALVEVLRRKSPWEAA